MPSQRGSRDRRSRHRILDRMEPSEPSGTATAIGVDIGGTGIKGAPVDVTAGAFAADRVRILDAVPGDARTGHRDRRRGPGPARRVRADRDHDARGGARRDRRDGGQHRRAWIGVDAADQFGRALGRDVTVMNDADAAGLAEMRFGRARAMPAAWSSSPSGPGSGAPCSPTASSSPTPSSVTCPWRAATRSTGRPTPGEREDLSWKHWAHRLERYFSLLESLLWPELIIVGGGVSKKAEKFLPHIDIRTPIVAAQLQNEAGIIGAPSSPRSLGHTLTRRRGVPTDRRRRRPPRQVKRASRRRSERMAMRRHRRTRLAAQGVCVSRSTPSAGRASGRPPPAASRHCAGRPRSPATPRTRSRAGPRATTA